MPSSKRFINIAAFVLFITSLLILLTDIFKIPANAGAEYNMDKVFYYGANIIFWLSIPYLLSLLIRKVIWKSEFKKLSGTKSVGMIEDASIILIYLISISILSVKLFNLEVSIGLISLFLIIMVITVYIRPRFLKMTKTGFIQAARPFKTGDWISLLNQSGNNFITGKVISFDGKSVQLRTENNTLLILPNSSLTNFVIENYQSIKKEVQFSVQMSLSPRVPIDRAKRIFTAAAKEALIKLSDSGNKFTEVFVSKVSRDSIEYKINFTFAPWSSSTPEKMKDLVLSNIVSHLHKAGITFDIDSSHNILAQVALFDDLEKSELEELSSSAKEMLISAGETVIRQGDAGSSMFILKEGLLNVMIKANEKADMKAAIITPGQFFGEMSLFTGEERSATITAETDSVIVEITKEALKKILDKKPDLINGFGNIIAERQSRNLKMMDDYLSRKESFMHKLVGKIKLFFEM